MRAMFTTARGVLLCLFAVSAVAQTPAAAPARPPAPANWPTAQFASAKDASVQKSFQILNDMIRAMGGDAWLNVHDMQAEGRTYGFSHGQPNGTGLVFWLFWEWPDKERVELTKQRDVVEMFNGDKGYEITYKGTAPQDPKAMEDYLRRRDHSLEWVVRKWLPAAGTTILYSGTALVERNLADQVTILNANNDSVTLSIDGTSRLPVKLTYSWRDPADRQFDEDAIIYGNYKPVQGVQSPYTTVRYRDGEMTNQRFVTSYTYNAGLAPNLFEAKGAVYTPGKQPPKK